VSVPACVSVRQSVREHISETARPIFAEFLCMLPKSLARSSSGGVGIRYVRLVLWMTSLLALCWHVDSVAASDVNAS